MPLFDMPAIWEMNRGDSVTHSENLPQVLELPSGGVLQPQDPQDRRTGHFLRDLFSRRDYLTHMESQDPCDCHHPQHARPYGQPQTYRPQRQTPFQQALSQQGLCDSVAQKFGMTWDQFCQCSKCGGRGAPSRGMARPRRRRAMTSREYMMRRAPYAHGYYRPRRRRRAMAAGESAYRLRKRKAIYRETGEAVPFVYPAEHRAAVGRPRRRYMSSAARARLARFGPGMGYTPRQRRRYARPAGYYEELRRRYGGRSRRKPTRAHPYRGRHIFTAQDRELAMLARSERYQPDVEGTQF